ncbi:hypothetical protein ACFV1C_21670 [Streptomyces sp. NPDC059605]|uniref:hypothetical protein n=1 Tax=unclassified Streptomyces TaxID=2593676 RepID=UPI003676E4A4
MMETAGMRAEDVAAGLFAVLETGDAAPAAQVVHDGFTDREAAVAPAACSVPGPAAEPAAAAHG